MNGSLAIPELMFSPQAGADVASATRLPASPGAIARFEQLMYSPAQGGAGVDSAFALAGPQGVGMHSYFEKLSSRWETGQAALAVLSEKGNIGAHELVRTQMHLINCALDMEVSSKCAGMFENGVQTLVQRSG